MAARDALIPICSPEVLANGARGVRFEVSFRGERTPAFVVRHRGIAVAYLTRCAHVAMELDWQPGEFFEPDAEFLMCSTHGALYDPATGACRGGACAGHGGLRPITVVEHAHSVCWVPDHHTRPLDDSL
jgi:nitrite reductase/ring-hydroxylating ferredoxin subunit